MLDMSDTVSSFFSTLFFYLSITWAYLENQVKIASLGGIQVIISAMKAQNGHKETQEQGCRALGNLALSSGMRRCRL